MKLCLISIIFIMLLAIPINAEIINFNIEFNPNLNFTKEYKLDFKNEQFELSTIRIKPMISINNKEYNLSYINKSVFIKDNLYNYEFGYIINNIALNNIDYVSFEINGIKKLDEISYTDGKFRIIFNDLEDKGNLQLLENKIILYNPNSLTIHPIIELLPNTTNKAYTSGTLTSMNYNGATTEFTSIAYSQVNISDNTRFALTVSSTTTQPRYRTSRYTFNLTAFDINFSSINNITACFEGFHNDNNGIGNSELRWYNFTSASWLSWVSSVNYGTNDTVYCLLFNSSNKTYIYNSTSGLIQFGCGTQANPLVSVGVSSLSTDFFNVTINYNVSEIPPVVQNITQCEYFCYPFKEVVNKEEMEILFKQNLILDNKYIIENLENEETENTCKIFWYNKDFKHENFCINLYSRKAIILSEINEENFNFIDWVLSIFHANTS